MTEADHANLKSRTAEFFKRRNVQLALLLIVWIATIASIAAKDNQWDFKVYYYASIAQAHGDNPYDLEILNKYSPDQIIFPFVYPVVTCYLFRPFTLLPYGIAYEIWLLIKVGLAIYLLWLWRKRFLPWGPLPLLILVATGTYLGALYRDLNSGNITLIEQVLLWSGIYWLLEGKVYRFVLLIAAAASFKLSLAVFLITVLLTKFKSRVLAFGLGCALVLGYVAAVWTIDGQAFESFWQAGSSIKEFTADFNHSTLAVFHDLGKLVVGNEVDSDTGRTTILSLYLAFATVVGVVTIRSIRRFRVLEPREALFMTICALCFLYILAMPRAKNYAFILLAVPTYLVLTWGMRHRMVAILAILLVFPRIKVASPSTVIGFYQYLHPWLMAVIVWMIFVSYSGSRLDRLPLRR